MSNVKVLAGAAGLLLALVLVVCMAIPAMAIPQIPEQFYGSVTGNVSQVGFIVSARIGGVEFGNGTVDSQGIYGNCSTTGCFYVRADDPDTLVKEGGVNGDIVQFYVAGVLASPSVSFLSGNITRLDLAVGAVTQYTLTVSTTAGGNVTQPGLGNFTYNTGTAVPLVATPDPGYAFGTWTGDVGTVGNATAGNTSITMNGNYAITANFVAVTQYTLTVSTTAGGNVTQPGLGNFTYNTGTAVPLVATPDAGYCFSTWTGDVGTVANANLANTTITMNGNYAIQANFVQQYTLNVSSGAGGTVTTPGIGAFSYCPGVVASLVATPDLGYAFGTWTGGPVGNATAASTTITMNGNYTIQANFNFVGTHWLVVNTTTGGTVTQPGVGNTTQTAGAQVPLVAAPDATHCFGSWTGDVGTIVSPTAANTTITMNGDYTITANFVAKYTLTISSTSGGTVTTPGVGSFTYCPGIVVSLVASPTSGCFVNWTGGPVGSASAASTTITMNGNYTIQANFVAKYTLTVTSGTGGTVTTPGLGSFSYCPGIVVSLVATANSGYAFVNWTGNGTAASPTAASTTITMNGSYAIQANFQSTGGGGGGGGGGGATPTPTPTPTGPTPTPTPVVTPPPIPTPTPINISGNVTGNGTVTQTIVYSVLDGQAVLTIGTGTTALTATGGPLQSVAVVEVCLNIPQPQCVVGCAYDYTPNGATFSPAVTLTLKYDPGMVPSGVDASKLAIAYYNTATSKWVVVAGSVVDTVNHTVTAQVSHFTLFAVYGCAPSATPTPTVTVGPTPTPKPTPTPTPVVGGKKTNIGVIIGPIIAVIIIALVAYWFWSRRRKPPAPPAAAEGPKKT